MHILILNWRDPKNPKAGGAEIVTMEHAKAWVKAGHRVVWFTSSFKGAKGSENIDGISIIRKGNSLSVLLLAPFFYLFSEIHFDTVIDEIHGLPFFTPLYVRKPKKIAFIHEVAGEIWDYMYPFPLNIIGRILESIYFQFYKHIPFWTDAHSTIDDLVKQGIPRQNSTAIACPINNKVVSTLPQKEKNPTFLFVSRLVKMKGIECVLEAFRFVLEKKPQANLWIVGGGEEAYVSQLKSTFSDIIPHVKFFGRVSDNKKLELMGKAHLLLHASVKEGWGLVVLEAASQGTPAVVYNVTGLRDSVKSNQTGIVLQNNSPLKMAKQSLLLLRDKVKYKKLQQGGLQWVKSLSWEKSTQQSIHLLKEVGASK